MWCAYWLDIIRPNNHEAIYVLAWISYKLVYFVSHTVKLNECECSSSLLSALLLLNWL